MSADPAPPDWDLLTGLFDARPFHHHMGLRRAEAADFYRATPEGAEIFLGKRAILEGPDGWRHSVADPAAQPAVEEFASLLGLDWPAAAEPLALNRWLGLSVEPDVLFLTPSNWRLAWANVCFPTRWSLEGKLGQPLEEIHAVVPRLNAQLGRKIGTFFERLAPGEGWRRTNWGLSASAQRNQHPGLALPCLTASTPPEEIFLRVESQHLLRLPSVGAVVFGIRIRHFRLAEALAQPGVRAGLEEKLRTMPPDVADYKALTAVRPRLAPGAE